MALPSHRVDRSTLMFSVVAALACITRIASTSITTRLATTVFSPSPLFGLAVTASAVEILSLIALVTAVGLFLRRVSRGLILLAWIPGVFSCLVGTILGLVTLASAVYYANEGRLDKYDYYTTRELAGVGLATSVLGLLPQTAFYVLIWPRSAQNVDTLEETLPERSSPSRSSKRRSFLVHLGSLSPGSPKFLHAPSEPTVPGYSAVSGSPRSSHRHSASNSVRPMTSRTRLLLHTSFASKDSRSIVPTVEPLPEERRNTDDFEDWDTSAVEGSFEVPLRKKPSATRLETIPGSRPVSPAHPLDGPFQDNATPEELPLPDSPALQSPAACASPNSETGSIRTFPRARSRHGSNDQAHIHPLFRTESPVPPPLISPGTVITASPYAGQIVSPDAASLPRILYAAHGSRPASPSYMSPARSRAGSIKSFRTGPPSRDSPFDAAERSCSQLSWSLTPQSND